MSSYLRDTTLALQWKHVRDDHISVEQRIYRGIVDSPKTHHSVRKVALPERVRTEIQIWREASGSPDAEAWVFPSERLRTPVGRDNCWRRTIGPRLKEVGLQWVNFQVMRRTHSSLMRELNVDPKIIADQLGHTLDVNLNVYTDSGLELRKEAVKTLESALWVM